MVKYLMGHPNINLNVIYEDKRTPLWWAAARGHLGIVKLLLAHPLTKRRWKDCTGKTAHAIAKDRGHGHVKMLLRDF